jgi:hypothetical protein
MSGGFTFKKVRDLEWQARSDNFRPTKDAMNYYQKKYKNLYPFGKVSIIEKPGDWYTDGHDYFCINIVFKNIEDEALFLFKESAR